MGTELRFLTGGTRPSNAEVQESRRRANAGPSIWNALLQPPIGSMLMWGGNIDTPDGKWLLCNGRTLLITDYPELFDIMGTVYNRVGDASGVFRVPDMRGRVPMGAGAGTGLTSRAEGTNLGEERHTTSTSEMPSHNHRTIDPVGNQDVSYSALGDHGHGATAGTTNLTHAHGGGTGDTSVGHTHNVTTGQYFSMSGTFGSGRRVMSPDNWDGNVDKTTGGVNPPGTTHSHTINNGLGDHGHTITINTTNLAHQHAISIQSTGGGGSHNNIQPALVTNFIIRVTA